MKLDLTEIVPNVGKRSRYEIDEPPIEDLADDLRCADGIKGDVTFSNAGSNIIVRGGFSSAVELDCSRCLKRYRMYLDLPIEEELPVHGHLPEDAESEYEELPEEEKEPLFEDNIFDLTELLRQSILVALPIKPLCSEVCKGLCTRCGKDLDEGPCGCPPEDANPAFVALESLLHNEEET